MQGSAGGKVAARASDRRTAAGPPAPPHPSFAFDLPAHVPACPAVPDAGKSSTAGSEHDTESLGSLEYGSRASGGGRRAQREPGFEEELVEVDPFDTAVEQLYEKRCEEGLGVVGYAATDELHSAWRSSRIAACMNVSGVQGYNA